MVFENHNFINLENGCNPGDFANEICSKSTGLRNLKNRIRKTDGQMRHLCCFIFLFFDCDVLFFFLNIDFMCIIVLLVWYFAPFFLFLQNFLFFDYLFMLSCNCCIVYFLLMCDNHFAFLCQHSDYYNNKLIKQL